MTKQKYKAIKKGASSALSFVCKPMEYKGSVKAPWSAEDRELVVQLVRHMRRAGAISMSANQIGGEFQVCCTNVPGDYIRIFVNPELDIVDYDEELVDEACASFPRSTAQRYRHRNVIVSARTFDGNPIYLDTSDTMFPEHVSRLLSYRLQHEVEHLRGVNVREDVQMVPDG